MGIGIKAAAVEWKMHEKDFHLLFFSLSFTLDGTRNFFFHETADYEVGKLNEWQTYFD